MHQRLSAAPDSLVRGVEDHQSRPLASLHFPSAHLHAGLSGEQVLQRIGSICLRHLIDNEAAARAGGAEGIHQMRVAVRRLRAIIATFGRMLPDEEKIKASAELHWFADVLGAARNLDVFVSELMAPAPAHIAGASEFQRLARAIQRRRLIAHKAALEAITSDRYNASVEATRKWFDRGEWRRFDEGAALKRPIAELAPVLLERRFRRVKKRARNFASQSQTQRHALRIAIKKLRYAADPLASIFASKKSDSFVRQLKRLQDDLGLMNDLSVARGIVASMVDQHAPVIGIGNAAHRLFAWHERSLSMREPVVGRHLQLLLGSKRPWLSVTSVEKPVIGTARRSSSVTLIGTLIQNVGTCPAVGMDPVPITGRERAPGMSLRLSSNYPLANE